MNSQIAANFGRRRAARFRSGGSALSIECRTIRRCTPNVLATPTIVPQPYSYSRLSSSNNSTFHLLSISSPLSRFSRETEYRVPRVKVGHFWLPNWANSYCRTHPTEGAADLPNAKGSCGAAEGEATNCLRVGE